MKAFVLMMLLASSTNNAYRLSKRLQINTKANPEVADIMSLADDKEYMNSQSATLFEQNFHDTDKYSMSATQYQ